jgi:oligo-1,6-glucosidase
MMAGLLMTLRGTPFVYEGQEIGMVNGDFKDLSEVEDIESHNIYAMAKGLGIPKKIRWKMIQRTSRDNARTPMQWSAEQGAGFTTGKPWLKINENYKTVNVSTESALEDGVLAFWKKMIALRKSDKTLAEGSFSSVYEGSHVYAFARELGERRLISVCNMSAKVLKLPKALQGIGKLIACSRADAGDRLKPFEFRLYECETVK